ncbi:MAG: hypothetical protein FJ278_24545 [Planctomycetes bacterium]|nr:hypothetical protein [Planctomycetota bacterium]
MRHPFLCSAASAILAVSSVGTAISGAEAADKAPQVIILKLDDVTASGAQKGPPVSPRWQRVADFVETSNLKAAFGIIGWFLEQDNPAYFDWIKNLDKKGIIEFWNHGYKNRKAEDKAGEFEGPFEDQRSSLEKTQALAKQKLGIELKAFGPHWSGTTKDTERALDAIPEITMWFYGPKDSRKFVFERVLTLENPTFVPDFDKFRNTYEKFAQNKPCMALQGHPNSWDDKRWDGFVRIVEYLRARGCVFMTPSEYMQKAPKRQE